MVNTRKTGNQKANWALKYMENSDVTCSADIRFFRHRKNAHTAMVNDFQRQDTEVSPTKAFMFKWESIPSTGKS